MDRRDKCCKTTNPCSAQKKFPIKTLAEIRGKFELKLVKWPKFGYVYPDRTTFFIKMLMTLDPKSCPRRSNFIYLKLTRCWETYNKRSVSFIHFFSQNIYSCMYRSGTFIYVASIFGCLLLTMIVLLSTYLNIYIDVRRLHKLILIVVHE